MPDWTWERIAKHDTLTEGPAWCGEALLYSECEPALTWRWDPATRESTVRRRDTGGANGMVFDRQGRLFACEGAARRIVQYEKDRPTRVVVDSYQGNALNEPNDLAIDDAGRIWFTDPAYVMYEGWTPELGHESVYRADPQPDGSWTASRVTFDTTRPNGILVSPDQKTLYVAESPRPPEPGRQLRAYPIGEDGTLGDHRVLHDFGPHRGIDGMCLNTDGSIVATAGFRESGSGPMIYVFAHSGRVLSTHPAPADRPTNCTFGGPALDVLFVTFGVGDVYRVPGTGMRGHLAYPPPR